MSLSLTQLKQLKIGSLFMLTLAGVVNAIGVTVFLAPVQLYDSGISGTSMLLGQLTPPPLSLFLLVLNIPLFLYGLKRQGVLFTFCAIYTVSVYSLVAWLITAVLPIDVATASPLAGSDLLLCAIFGGIVSGMGSGLAIRNGGAMDGIEVMAVIFAKRMGISVGTFVMGYNIVLYIFCGIFTHSWILPLYSIIAYYAALKTVDYIVEGIDRSKAAMIVTTRPNEVCAALGQAFGHGMTILDARGGYSGNVKNIVYFVVNRFQVVRMKNIVHSIDPTAYITINEVADIYSSNQDSQEHS